MMIARLLNARVAEYRPTNAIEQENVLKELMQHFILAGLARARFFVQGVFHGGTSLRILRGTTRFSEDLDFLLRQPDPEFGWLPFLEKVQRDCEIEGIFFEVQDKSKPEQAVRKAFLKTDSLGGMESLDLPFGRQASQKIRIKLEVDTNPPAGSSFETHFITFPMNSAITTQTIESSFASKSHALLCRQYTKGRDWYDLLWYISKGVRPEFTHLSHALEQQGPWAGKAVQVTPEWYLEVLRDRIEKIDWEEAKADISRFVTSREQQSIALWSRDFFLYQVERLAGQIKEDE